ncbi:MAG: gamma-glutamyltransferase [Alphaproteobacteria bacterium]
MSGKLRKLLLAGRAQFSGRAVAIALPVLAALYSGGSLAQEAADAISPEAATGRAIMLAGPTVQPVSAKNWMVVAANPHAARAGADILEAGGSAADAAIAVQLVLGLVEPQSSGLGGGAFLLYWDATTDSLITLDGRETAPAAATPKLFQDDSGEPLKFFDVVVGGRSVGVPGTPMLLSQMHRRWGRSAWSSLFNRAIDLAETGFAVSPRLAGLIARGKDRLARHPATQAYFFGADGEPLGEGVTLRNPAYAATLRTLAAEGTAPFYAGPIAATIVNTVTSAPGNPGLLSLADLANYRIHERPAVCVEYRAHNVCGMGPPSSGGLTVGQTLGLLAPFDLASLGPDSTDAWRLIGDASRLAFADRGRYMADSDFVPMPTAGLVSRKYLDERAVPLGAGGRLETVAPGTPEWDHALNLADDDAIELPSTSHFVIVDAAGNIASMTTTIENGFGSRLMAAGFLLNNELTDFSFRSHRDGVPIANRVEPGKRPRSSMAPTIVFRNSAPVLAVGSPGGSRIIGYVAKTLVAIIDWNMNVQDAINLPHLVNRFGTYDLEKGTAAENFGPALEAFGYKINARALTSGLHGISIGSDGLLGGADPRREGVAIGR